MRPRQVPWRLLTCYIFLAVDPEKSSELMKIEINKPQSLLIIYLNALPHSPIFFIGVDDACTT